jgi:hypothetical protein
MLFFQVTAETVPGARLVKVEQKITEYTWKMLSQNSKTVLCTIQIYHTGKPTLEEVLAACSDALGFATPTSAISGTPQATATPVSAGEVLSAGYFVFSSTQEVVQVKQVEVGPISVTISAPEDFVAAPVVILSGFEPAAQYGYSITGIQGYLQGIKFECDSGNCTIPLRGDGEIIYWATSSAGDESAHFSVQVRVSYQAEGYKITLATTPTTTSDQTWYQDACTIAWDGYISGTPPAWQNLPLVPDALHTEKSLFLLAARLLQNKLADASSCDNGGFFSDGTVNACGMEKVKDALVIWQNRFDPAIWSASREFGVPAKLIKAVMQQESQFWPENTKQGAVEYGIAQVDETGADVLLRWDAQYQAEVCPGVLFDCSIPYARMAPGDQALLRGAVLQRLNAECPSCTYGINIPKAEQSVRVLARMVRANCYQSAYLMEKYEVRSDISDAWRLALISYHGGYQCLNNALLTISRDRSSTQWSNLSSYVNSCPYVVDYVENIFQTLSTFQDYKATPSPGTVVKISTSTPTIAPTPTITPIPPTKTPVPGLVNGKISVLVYVDFNNNNLSEANEQLDGLEVDARFTDGKVIVQNLIKGEAVIEFKEQPANSISIVSIPYLFREIPVLIPESGEAFVVFRLPPPSVPNQLP